MPNQYVNKVVQSNGTTLMDITDTTAVASDVSAGKYFYLSTGEKVEGSASGGSVTVTDEANAAGITCVITTGGGDEPTPSGDIPLNTELVDYTAITSGYYVDDDGTIVAGDPWNCITDYLPIDSSMTFSFICASWYGVGFYDVSKNLIRGYIANDIPSSTVSGDYVHGTLTSSVIPSNAAYVVLTGNPYSLSSNTLSLIRTA